MTRCPPHELYHQAVDSHGRQGEDAVRAEYRRLMVEHGHLVPGEPEPAACGWMPGQGLRQPLTVVVTGDRDWAHPAMLHLVLGGLALGYDRAACGPGFQVFVGDCPTGADAQALQFCERGEMAHRVFRARWDEMEAEGKPRRAGGPLRNFEMLHALEAAPGDHLVVAFHDQLPKSRGTRHCVNAAVERGLPVYLVGKITGQVMPG